MCHPESTVWEIKRTNVIMFMMCALWLTKATKSGRLAVKISSAQPYKHYGMYTYLKALVSKLVSQSVEISIKEQKFIANYWKHFGLH